MSFFQLDGVEKIYRKGFTRKAFKALSGIDLSVSPGETVGFIGHNGAGKSSTIRIMLGLQKPSKGTALIRGMPATEPAARKGIAYVPESPLVYDHLTPLELLAMSLKLHGYSGDIARQCSKWLGRLGLTGVGTKRVRGFSKGMVQRTALAMALCTEPLALVLDEPLSGLDPIGRREIVEILEEYRRAGNTLFFSSHVLSDVERLADRFLFIHQGKIRASYDVDAVLKAAAGSYELTISSEHGMPGYQQIGKRLWLKVLEVSQLTDEIETARQGGALIHSVKGAANLERLYIQLVDQQG